MTADGNLTTTILPYLLVLSVGCLDEPYCQRTGLTLRCRKTHTFINHDSV